MIQNGKQSSNQTHLELEKEKEKKNHGTKSFPII